MGPTEDREQINFVQWFRRTYPEVKIYAIPNGSYRHKKTAALLKATGVLKGVSDLHVPEWNLWIEMKRGKGGRLSPEQKEWGEYVESLGHTFIVGHGFSDAAEKVKKLAVDCGFTVK